MILTRSLVIAALLPGIALAQDGIDPTRPPSVMTAPVGTFDPFRDRVDVALAANHGDLERF